MTKHNTTGEVRSNIPCDLHLEHLNRRLKGILGSNIDPKCIVRAGQIVPTVHKVCQVFESETSGKLNHTRHPYPSFCKDLNIVLKVFHKVSLGYEKDVTIHNITMDCCKEMIEETDQKRSKRY